MKPTTIQILLLAVGLSTFGLTGCNKRDRADVSVNASEIVGESKEAIGHGWDNVNSLTFEKREDFRANAGAKTSKMDAQTSDLRTNYSEAKASCKAVMSDMKDAEATYKEKREALGTATADTWDSAKQNVISAWDHLEASYYKARAG